MAKIVGCVVFSVKTDDNVKDDGLGKKITKWIEVNPFAQIEQKEFVQSDSYMSVMFLYSGQVGAVNPLDM